MKIACHILNNSVLQQVRSVLVQAGMECENFPSETLLVRGIRREPFALILVDLHAESQDSESIFSWLNCRSGELTPVLILSPISRADFVATALNAGADDFIPRPFESVEMIARIHALLRRSGKKPARRMIDLAGFSLDREACTFSYRGTPIELTPREFTMAWLLFSTPGVYISRETIGTAVWGTNSEIAGRTIEQHVYKLRKKLQAKGDAGVIIRTAYSQGYRLEIRSLPQEQST